MDQNEVTTIWLPNDSKNESPHAHFVPLCDQEGAIDKVSMTPPVAAAVAAAAKTWQLLNTVANKRARVAVSTCHLDVSVKSGAFEATSVVFLEGSVQFPP